MYFNAEYPLFRYEDINGDPGIGYEVYAYDAGTTTPANTYQDRSLTIANTWPIILDSRGEAIVFVGRATKLLVTIPGGDPASPLETFDWIGEQYDIFISATSTPGTANNNYLVNTIPAVLALSPAMQLIMIPDVSNSDTISSTVFTGTGINDLDAIGPYIGTVSTTFSIQIDGTSSPNTFKWRKGSGTWVTGVAITGSNQVLQENFAVKFSVITGHTLNDLWVVTVQTPARVNLCSLGNLLVYKNKGGSIVALDGDDIVAGYPTVMVLNQSLNGWLLLNPATPTFSTPTITAVVYRKVVTNTYSMLAGDEGYEISCDGTFALNLLPCSQFSNKIFYITNNTNSAAAYTTVTAYGSEKIYGAGNYAGANTFILPTGFSIKLQSNGVDWHILSCTRVSRGFVFYTLAQTGSSWLWPYGITSIKVTLAGGGGSGGSSGDAGNAGGGGGAGSLVTSVITNGVQGTSYLVTVGAGGGAVYGSAGAAGGTSSLGALVSATGGGGGQIAGGSFAGGACANFSGTSGENGTGIATTTAGGKNYPSGAFGNYAGGGYGIAGFFNSGAGYPGFVMIEY